ncbi:Kelch repeat-containing protein [Spongiimicrobium salis]|uniref:Kelch repeat-containing protein n=1 Tax=Spongiimicrobium salis TaxID=1667022 RepID=UPI00374CF93D
MKTLIIPLLILCCTACTTTTVDELSAQNGIEKSNALVAKTKTVKAEKMTKEVPFSARTEHTSLVFKKQQWIMGGHAQGGFRNDIWSSEDGKTWKVINHNAAFKKRRSHGATVLHDQLWIVGGESGSPGSLKQHNDVWFSKDGKSWFEVTKNAPFSKRKEHTLNSFNGRMWVIGGTDKNTGSKSDIWVSGDGKNWSLAKKNAPFGPREGHTTVVFDDKLWVIGGYQNILKNGVWQSQYYNDVWYSSNGFDWFLATPDAKFSPRRNHSSVSDGKAMWTMAGNGNNYTYFNDVWRSEDGINWNKVSLSDSYEERSGHSSIFFDSKLWIINGYPIFSNFQNGIITQYGFHSDIWTLNAN